MVGSRFCELQKTFDLVEADYRKSPSIDLTNKESIASFFDQQDFEIAILFSAFTDVDGAQKQRGDKDGPAWKINVEGVESIAQFCRQKNVKLIFISSDFVFDGKGGPYSEDSPRAENEDSVSWYGYTKIKGEEIVESLTDYLILRIAFPYRGNFKDKDDFARSVIKKYDSGELYPMFADQYFTPTFIDDVAAALELLVTKQMSGIYHLASPEVTTPFEFANYLLEVFDRDTKILKSSSIIEFQKNSETPRPVRGGLMVDKIVSLGFTPTGWKDGIEKLHQQTGGKLI